MPMTLGRSQQVRCLGSLADKVHGLFVRGRLWRLRRAYILYDRPLLIGHFVIKRADFRDLLRHDRSPCPTCAF